MAKHSHLPTIPLPRGWPSRVKSAVLHAISSAQLALAYTRSWAVDSQVARRTERPAPSAAPDGVEPPRRLLVTHPFHPLHGREFALVTCRHNWGEEDQPVKTRA